MNSTIMVGDLLQFILYFLGAVLLVVLILFVKNLVGVVKGVREIVESNRENIDLILNDAPEITSNVNRITSDVKYTIEEVQPNIPRITKNVSYITRDVSEITNNVNEISRTVTRGVEDLGDTVEVIRESAIDTSSSIKENIQGISHYIEIAGEVIKAIKRYFK